MLMKAGGHRRVHVGQLLQLSHGTECAMNIVIGSATHVVV